MVIDGIKFRFYPLVADRTRKTMQSLAGLFSEFVAINRPVKIIVVPAITLKYEGGVGFGMFRYWLDRNDSEIWVAGEKPPELPHSFHRQWLADVLAHELAHYEQWRNEKCVQERGIAVRARTILRRCGVEIPKDWPLNNRN